MISREDCIALCGLDTEQVAALAEHEHLPEVTAAALASYLLNKSGGESEIARMMIDDIRAALAEDRPQRASEIFSALRHFASQHPELVQGSPAH